jgi:S1-C subfamily serine protease
MGLTLTRNNALGTAWVSKVNAGGQAAALGVQLGDVVVGIENRWVGSYDEVMQDLPTRQVPFALVFRRNASGSVSM